MASTAFSAQAIHPSKTFRSSSVGCSFFFGGGIVFNRITSRTLPQRRMSSFAAALSFKLSRSTSPFLTSPSWHSKQERSSTGMML
jgi:hypothetical protein